MNAIEEFLNTNMDKIENKGECKVIIEYLGADPDDDDCIWDLVNFEIQLDGETYDMQTFQYPSPVIEEEFEDEEFEEFEEFEDEDDPNGYKELCRNAGFSDKDIIIK